MHQDRCAHPHTMSNDLYTNYWLATTIEFAVPRRKRIPQDGVVKRGNSFPPNLKHVAGRGELHRGIKRMRTLVIKCFETGQHTFKQPGCDEPAHPIPLSKRPIIF